jgi:uncharacterized membrane protein
VRESLFVNKRRDVGNFTQALWSTAHGHFLQVTEVGGQEVSRLGIHVDPIFVVLTPLWWIWPSPMLLLTVQAIAVALGAIPLFWLGRRHLPRERDAALVAIAYLLCPTVGWNVVSDFHAVAFALPLLLFAIWYLDEDRLVPFAVTAGAATLCQEQIGLMVGCLGLWYAWQRRRLAVGLVIAAAGFAVSAIDFLVVIPHFSAGSPYAARFGGSPKELLRDLFTHPLRLVAQINTHDLLGLVLALPVLGFCFGSTLMLAASPQIALLVLSRRPGDWGPLGINVLLLVPFIYAACVYTLGRSASRERRRGPKLVAGQLFAASFAMAVVLSPLSIFGLQQVFRPHSSVSDQRQALSLIPANARVSATGRLALPLAGRQSLYVFPVLKNAQWTVVDSRDTYLPNIAHLHKRVGIAVPINDLSWQPKLMRRRLHFLERSPKWRLVYRRGTIYVFKRQRVNSGSATS